MSVYKTKTANSWKLDFRAQRVGEDFRVTRVFDTKSQAEAEEHRLRGQLERARLKGRGMPDSQITLGDALADWRTESESEAPGAKRIKHRANLDDHREKSRIKKWEQSRLAPVRLVDLGPNHLEGWVDSEREDDRAESTIRNDLSLLNRLYKYVRGKWRWEMENPIPDVLDDVGHSNKRDRRLSTDEHRLLLDAFTKLEEAQKASASQLDADPLYKISLKNETTGKTLELHPHESLLYIKAAYLGGIECAMRRGKLFEIQWSWIDWKGRDIAVPSQLTGPANKQVPSRVPISPLLFSTLEKLRGPVQIGAALEGFIFGPLLADRAYRLLKDVCEFCDIEDFRWHDLRHEACSRLADLGWTPPQIQRVSGHKTLQSLQRYVHVSTEAIHRLWNQQQQQTGT